MIDLSQYKQDLWKQYNWYINEYSNMNDNNSLNVRLIHMDPSQSNWDNIGGALENWSSVLTQLKWHVYENVPLFQNAPSTTSNAPHSVDAIQTFTASIKFIIEPLPNDMLMYYDDPSNTVYTITDVRFNKTIQNNIKLFDIDLQTAYVDDQEVFNLLNIAEHQFYNQFNQKLFDYFTFKNTYLPIIETMDEIIRKCNNKFDPNSETYTCKEINNIVRQIKRCSRYGAISSLKTPFGENEIPCENGDLVLLDKLYKLKDILC